MAAPVVLVARAAGSVGEAICWRMAERGWDVVVNFEQDDQAAQRAAGSVRDAGQQAIVQGGRVGDPMVAQALVRRTLREVGRLDGLVVCPRRGPIAEAPASDDPAEAFLDVDMGAVEPVLQADLKGPLALLQSVGGHLLDNDGGPIVVVGTGGAVRSGPAGAPARAAQDGLIALVRVGARALGPAVRVNAIVPGLIAPEDVDPEALDVSGGRGDPDAWVAPEGVARTAVHLVEAPQEVTGQVVTVDRGVGAQRLEARPWDREDQTGDAGLPGIDRRVEPPDPDERIDLE